MLNQATLNAARTPSVSSAVEDFDPVLSRLESIGARAMLCADRLVGSRPSGVDKPETAPSPSHLLFSLQARRERLVRCADLLESELERIAQGIGLERN